MKLKYNAICNRGLARRSNEDSILVGNQILRDDADSFCFDIPASGIIFPAIVFDGVGGNARGEEASMTACETLRTFFENLPAGNEANRLIMTLKSEMTRVNRLILSKGAGCGMATTLTGMLLYGSDAYLLNAGDSRVYRLRYGNFKLMTREHAYLHNGHRIITNCLGIPDAILDITPTAIVPGDTFIICSDGLFDMVSDFDMAANAASAETLLAKALDAGGHDNISIITLQFD